MSHQLFLCKRLFILGDVSCPGPAAAASLHSPKLMMDPKSKMLEGGSHSGLSLGGGPISPPLVAVCGGGGGGKRGSKSSIFGGLRQTSVNEEGYSRPTFVQTTPNVSTHGVST